MNLEQILWVKLCRWLFCFVVKCP